LTHGAPALLLDAGNTRLKSAWLSDAGLSVGPAWLHSDADPRELASFLDQQTGPAKRILLASVKADSVDRWDLDTLAAQRQIPLQRMLSPPHCAGWTTSYAEPARLGVDRFLMMLACVTQAPGRSHTIVSAGTAITVDVVDADGQHLGGRIAPGLALQANSLGLSTSQVRPDWLELESLLTAAPALGRDTKTAVASALAAMLRGLLRALPTTDHLWFSGGDGAWLLAFAAQRQPSAQLAPHLVLEGLAVYAAISTSQPPATGSTVI
jgi:type III pantothenate kinase